MEAKIEIVKTSFSSTFHEIEIQVLHVNLALKNHSTVKRIQLTSFRIYDLWHAININITLHYHLLNTRQHQLFEDFFSNRKFSLAISKTRTTVLKLLVDSKFFLFIRNRCWGALACRLRRKDGSLFSPIYANFGDWMKSKTASSWIVMAILRSITIFRNHSLPKSLIYWFKLNTLVRIN